MSDGARDPYTGMNAQGRGERTCRSCAAGLDRVFVDLGSMPLANAFLQADALNRIEPFYPLRGYVCEKCFLVQLETFVSPEEIFDDYAYFSSYSETWLDHAARYTDEVVPRLGLTEESFVVEVASNDGYLLRNFVGRGIPALGIEPAANVAGAAMEAGVPTRTAFFDSRLARELARTRGKADLVIGNNVLAHTPRLNDFTEGLKTLLADGGTITMEFPHLAPMIREGLFDTIYHEHFSYFSLTAVQNVFSRHGLSIHDVQKLPSHGGSLRIFAGHTADDGLPAGESVAALLDEEAAAGLNGTAAYDTFQERARRQKEAILSFLVRAREEGKTVAGYGAPAKGNTLLNYCGIRDDLIGFTADRNPHKQGLFLPGTHIPVVAPERIEETKPDYLVILPWNIRDEIMEQMAVVRSWGGKFVVLMPRVEVLE